MRARKKARREGFYLASRLEESKKKGRWVLAREILEFLEKEHPEELESGCISEEICELA